MLLGFSSHHPPENKQQDTHCKTKSQHMFVVCLHRQHKHNFKQLGFAFVLCVQNKQTYVGSLSFLFCSFCFAVGVLFCLFCLVVKKILTTHVCMSFVRVSVVSLLHLPGPGRYRLFVPDLCLFASKTSMLQTKQTLTNKHVLCLPVRQPPQRHQQTKLTNDRHQTKQQHATNKRKHNAPFYCLVITQQMARTQ